MIFDQVFGGIVLTCGVCAGAALLWAAWKERHTKNDPHWRDGIRPPGWPEGKF